MQANRLDVERVGYPNCYEMFELSCKEGLALERKNYGCTDVAQRTGPKQISHIFQQDWAEVTMSRGKPKPVLYIFRLCTEICVASNTRSSTFFTTTCLEQIWLKICIWTKLCLGHFILDLQHECMHFSPFVHLFYHTNNTQLKTKKNLV